MEIRKAEKLKLTLCPWVKNHADKGDNIYLRVGEGKFHIVSFQFNDWYFNECSVKFFMEFSRYFVDRIVELDIKACPDCQKELDQDIHRLIIEAHGVPPKGNT